MRRQPIVGVMGGGTADSADAATLAQAREVGRRLAAGGALLLCGGLGGVMEAAARGAREGGGRVIGVLPFAPGEGEPNPFIDCALLTGLGDGRNYVNAHTSDVLIALRGGPGTLSEIALALKLGVPVVLLDAWDFLAGQPALGPLGPLGDGPAVHVRSAEDAVAAAFRLIGFAAGEAFERPFAYPAMPDQSAVREQLLRVLEQGGTPMSVDLPTLIATYVAAENRGDMETLSQCFAEHAVVRDEGQTIAGLDAIKRWKAETKRKYRHTIEPLASAQRDGKTIVTNRVTGNFPGSPIDLQFIFEIDGDRIVSLEIR